MQTIDIFGYKVARITFQEALGEAMRLIAARKPSLIVTLNPEMLQQLRSDKELHAVLRGADLVVADGVGVVWASAMFGGACPERVTGVDLMFGIVERGAPNGLRTYLLGGKPGVADKAAENLQKRYPGLQVVGTMDGYFRPEEDERITNEIKSAKPDLLLAGMGVGKQEKWLFRHMNEIGVPLSIGIGGSLDVAAGVVRRAPEWTQKAKVEWLYRLCREPSRLKRQLVLPAFAWRVFVESRLKRPKE